MTFTRFIVTACNHFPAMLAVTKALVDAMGWVNQPKGTDRACIAYGNAWSAAERLIAQIEEG